MKQGTRRLGALLLCVLLIAADQATKLLAVARLKDQAPFVLLPGVLELRYLENRGAASGILSSHPKVIKGISAGMLCFCVLALGRERQRGKVTAAGIGYALLLGGGLSNFIDRVRKGSVTDYIRFPKVPVKKISEIVFNLSDFGIFAGVFCLLFRKK